MDVILHALGMPFNGRTIFEKSLGGSETAAYYQAKELAARGHRVTVFTTSPDEGTVDGVTYVNVGRSTQACPFGEKFHFFAANTPHDVLIVQRQPKVFHYQWASKVNILQCHDLALHRYSQDVGEGIWNLSAITGVSEWHADQMATVYPIPRAKFSVIPNGIDLEMYEAIPATEKFVNDGTLRLLYQSRPERGLEHLVRPGGIMDRLRGEAVHLYACAYDYTTQEMAGFYQQLDAWAEALPNVTFLGALSKPDLIAVQKAMDLLVYPTEFEEVSCITAMEAMAAGLPIIASEHAALPETTRDAGAWLIPLKGGKADEDAFVKHIAAQAKPDVSRTRMRELQAEKAKTLDWKDVAEKMERLFERLLLERAGNDTAAVRSAIELSDLDLVDWIGEIKHPTAIFERSMKEKHEMYDFRTSQEKYAAHYAKHQGAYYDGPGSQAVGEDVTQTSRFKGTTMAASDKIRASGGVGLTVLDYGCAHGHYLVPWAKALPESHFTGVDISARAIGAATKWVQQEGLANVDLVIGSQDWLTEADKRFDIIFACEVVEHVPDYKILLNRFRKLLKPDGMLVITTPYGRWEWIGHEASKTGREHMHLFERQDLLELFAGHKVDLTYAPAGQDECGFPIGSWITAIQFKNDHELVGVDMARKRAQYPTRQTVSACYIAKDAEHLLRRSLDSIAPYVDEVLIGIDKTTTDNTERLITEFARDNPWLTVASIRIPSPIEIGFDAARNLVHDMAAGDWIVWLDSDEEMIGAAALHKYLRPSLCNAVHFPQVHYSVQPATVIATDRPCRLYRNNIGARIYGMVHEHVEEEVGKAISHAIMRDDVQFCHAGYVTEEVRRKRYARNMPLLIKDVEKYPNRTLNKFLLMRDLAQGIVFAEQSGQHLNGVHHTDAQKVVDLFGEMLDSEMPVTRLLIDSLNYYSACVELLGGGFEAEMQFKTNRPPLAAGTSVKGRFLNREHFLKLNNRLFQEATSKYEDKYF